MASAEETYTPADQRRIATAGHTASDVATDRDRLGFEPYVRAAVDFVLDDDTKAPINLSIEGEWGTGKSSFMMQMQRALRAKGAKVVEFNAWRHDTEDSMWAAFALAFLEQLAAEMSWWRRLRAKWTLVDLRFDRQRGTVPFLLAFATSIAFLIVGGALAFFWIDGLLAGDAKGE